MRSTALRSLWGLPLVLLAPLFVSWSNQGEPTRQESGQEQEQDSGQEQEQDALLADFQAGLREAFEAAGIEFDPDHSLVSIPAQVAITNDLLEYVLTAPHGASHESLFVTGIDPEVLNTALLALGVTPGTGTQWKRKSPAPPVEDIKAGTPASEIVPPSGDGFYLYAGWTEGEDTYLRRIEDLVRNLDRGRTLRRHKFVYTGSSLTLATENRPEQFAASVTGNLINLSFFTAGATLLTGADPDCIKQTVWLANAWLMPPRGSDVRMIFSREPLEMIPAHVRSGLPILDAPSRD
tara:strand:+ start:758 stop:1636 length:879 start_codon:yes stop_codon:yes gene_type:complete